METVCTTKELYEIFLAQDFWKEFSRKKRDMVGRCQDCGTTDNLQAHHLVYRENWFDVQSDDLVVLCRACHEKRHGIAERVAVVKKKKKKQWRKRLPGKLGKMAHQIHVEMKRRGKRRPSYKKKQELRAKLGWIRELGRKLGKNVTIYRGKTIEQIKAEIG